MAAAPARDATAPGRPRPVGAFVGLATLDVVLGVEHVPAPDEKVVAASQLIAAGGPAANAAVAFAWAGGQARLLTVLGSHPLAVAAAADLRAHGVEVIDAAVDRTEAPTVAAILVTASSGERAVVSRTDRAVADGPIAPPPRSVDELLDGAGVVVADGHHAALAEPAVNAARARGVFVLLDGGTWRPAFERLVPLADAVVASPAFRPPGAAAGADGVLAAVLALGARFGAVTAGAGPIRWRVAADGGGSVVVPSVPVLDTLGAGDVLHGVMAAEIARRSRDARVPADVVAALAEGARVASASCAHPGTRSWLVMVPRREG